MINIVFDINSSILILFRNYDFVREIKSSTECIETSLWNLIFNKKIRNKKIVFTWEYIQMFQSEIMLFLSELIFWYLKMMT